jgi:hypothetical protein
MNGEKTNACKILVGNPEETTGKIKYVGEWIILKWIVERMGWYGLYRSGSG